MKTLIAGVAILIVSTLSMAPTAIAQNETELNATNCLIGGQSWSDCFPESTVNTSDPYESILSRFSDTGAGLGTLSAVQSLRKHLASRMYE